VGIAVVFIATVIFATLSYNFFEKPFLSLKMSPLVTIACDYVSINQSLKNEPIPGYLFHGSAPLILSGLPFFIEGQFLKLRRDGTVPFTAPNAMVLTQFLTRKLHLDYEACKLWNTSLLMTAVEVLIPKAMQDIKAKILNDFRKSENNSRLISLDYLYRYWPYAPRMTPSIREIISSSKLFPVLFELPLFLQGNEFKILNQCFLCSEYLTRELNDYLKSILPVSQAPIQIALDMKFIPSLQTISNPRLTPNIVIDVLKKTQSTAITFLMSNLSLILPLFKYCVSDLEGLLSTNDDEYNKSKSLPKLYTSWAPNLLK
jgi:hypothetical protein